MTLRIPTKVLIRVWSYDFYDMTLSTGKQRRHMIKRDSKKLKISLEKIDILNIFAEIIDCEYLQSLFWSKHKKKMYTPVNPISKG